MTERLRRLDRNDFESQLPSSPSQPGDNFFNEAMQHSPEQRDLDLEYQQGDSDNVNNVMENPSRDGPDRSHQQEDLKIDQADLTIDPQDSNPSVVAETQVLALEIDTQAESNPPLVENTQFVPLEIDTQAKTQAPASTTTSEAPTAFTDEVMFINASANGGTSAASPCRQLPNYPAAEPIKLLGLIKRPSITDAADAGPIFKFARPPKPTAIRQQSKALKNPFEAKLSAAERSSSAVEPHDQQKSDRPRGITAGIQTKLEDSTNHIQSLISDAALSIPPLPRAEAATRNSSSRKEQGTGSLHALPQGQSMPMQHVNQTQVRNTAEGSRVHYAAPAYVESMQSHLLRQSRPLETATNNEKVAASHDEARKHLVAPDPGSTRTSDANVQDGTESQHGQGHSMAFNGVRQTPRQQSYQQVYPSPAVHRERPGRKKSLTKLSAMPFPEAASRSASLHDRSASDQSKAISLAGMQDSIVPKIVEATCNEKRPRTIGRPFMARVDEGPKEHSIVRSSISPAGDYDVPTQHITSPFRVVHGHASPSPPSHTNPNLQPNNGAKHTDEDEQPACGPLHQFQEHSAATGRPHASLSANFIETDPQFDNGADHDLHSYRSVGYEQPMYANEDQDRATWEPVLDAAPKHEQREVFHSDHAQDISRTLSRASEMRPDSRRSNRGRPMTRPVRADDLMSRPSTARSCRVPTPRVSKSSGQLPGLSNSTAAAASKGAKTRVGFQQILEMSQEFEDVCLTNLEQEKVIASHQSRILKLEQSNTLSLQRVEALRMENSVLAKKMEKFSELSSKYKKHMNEVVHSQRYLKEESVRIQNKLEEALRMENKHRATYEKIQKAIKEARDMRGSAEELHNLNVELKQREQKLSLAQEQTQKLEEINERLHQDNNGFKAALDTEKKRLETLQNGFDRKSYSLSCELRAKEQLEKQLDSQTTVYREIIEHLKQLPEVVSEKLQNKESVLANTLTAENGTHSRISEMVSLVNQLRDNEPKIPAALVQLIEDLSSRFENREQNSDTSMDSFREATTKALDEVKETVKRLCLDESTQNQYHDRIRILEKANETLSIDRIARGHEIQSLTQQLDELRRDLTNCQDLLKSREGELTEARATPKDDPRLNTRIKELESATSVLKSQLDSANQERSKANDEVKSAREVVARKDQHIKGVEQKYNDAQKMIKSFNKKRDEYVAAQENESKAARQELVKKAEAQKETVRVKLESQFNNARQRCQEAESELVQAKQKMQEMQTQLDSQTKGASNESSTKAELLQQMREEIAQLQQVIARSTSQKVPAAIAQELQSIKIAARESHSSYELFKVELSETITGAAQEQRRIEDGIAKVGALSVEVQDLKYKFSAYERQIEKSSWVGDPPQQLSLRTDLGRDFAIASPNMPSPAAHTYPSYVHMQKGMQTTPRISHNDGVEDMRRLNTRDDQHKSSLQSTATVRLGRGNKEMVTPRQRVSLGLGDSRYAAATTSQQHTSASQDSASLIMPFAMLASSNTPDESGLNRATGRRDDDKNPGLANARTNSSKNVGGLPPAQVNARSTRTGSRQNVGTNGGSTSRNSPLESNLANSNTLVSSSHVFKRMKSALKQPVNQNLAAETSNVANTARQEVIPNAPRQAPGIGAIRGMRSGSIVEKSFPAAQNGKQSASAQSQAQDSPLPGPVGPRNQSKKRPLETGSNGAQKRTSSMQRWKSSKH